MPTVRSRVMLNTSVKTRNKSMPLFYFYLVVGGALGSCARYWMSAWVSKAFPSDIAIGTLSVNIFGSFVMGVFFMLIHDKMQIPESYKPLLITGFLGAFTTFSSFSMETVNHILNGQYWQAVSYILLSVVLCLLACTLGVFVVRII
jgi:CrcB protein